MYHSIGILFTRTHSTFTISPSTAYQIWIQWILIFTFGAVTNLYAWLWNILSILRKFYVFTVFARVILNFKNLIILHWTLSCLMKFLILRVTLVFTMDHLLIEILQRRIRNLNQYIPRHIYIFHMLNFHYCCSRGYLGQSHAFYLLRKDKYIVLQYQFEVSKRKTCIFYLVKKFDFFSFFFLVSGFT